MSRRMSDPNLVIKSQIVDDKYEVDLNEILEKYGTVTVDGEKTITLQIYNKLAVDDGSENGLSDDKGLVGLLVVNGSITVTKYSGGSVYIQGMLLDSDTRVFSPFSEIQSGSYENGIILYGNEEFDLYVIRV